MHRKSVFYSFIFVILIFRARGFDLGVNLIVNSDFSQPQMTPGSNFQLFGPSIPGWTCSSDCELQNCTLMAQYWSSQSIINGNCSAQVLDVCSAQIDSITQIFQAEGGQHQLAVTFILPLNRPNTAGKIIVIFFNQQQIYRYAPLTYDQYNPLSATVVVDTVIGANNITITQDGTNDDSGFRIISVACQKINNISNSSSSNAPKNLFLLNQITQSIIGIPGLRFIFVGLMNFLISLDRMQLYYYHDRQYSYYSDIFFSNIASLMDIKGELSIKALVEIFGEEINYEQEAIKGLDYKYAYINQQVISKSNNGYGFILNNVNLVLYSIPFFVISLGVFYILFKLTFNYKVSKILRRFFFVSIAFLILVCEGNIQQYSFYVFGEFNTFFSQNTRHKGVNCFIVCFFFLVVSTSVGLYLWIYSNRRKQISYYTQNTRKSLAGILCYTIDRGIVCILLGAAHQLLIPFPSYQLLVLGVIQATWIGFQTMGLKRKIYKNSLLVWLNIIQGFNRILFQLTLYLYSAAFNSSQDSSFLNEQIHFKQIFVFILIWAASFCLSLGIFIVQLVKSQPKKENYKLRQQLNKRVDIMTTIDDRRQKLTIKDATVYIRALKNKDTYHLMFRKGKIQLIDNSGLKNKP